MLRCLTTRLSPHRGSTLRSLRLNIPIFMSSTSRLARRVRVVYVSPTRKKRIKLTLLIRDLKPALTNVLGTIKNVANLPPLEAAKIVVGGGKIKFLATDRFAAIEHEIEYNTDAE